MAALDVPRLSWPLRFDGPSLAVVEQDSLDEVAECVALLCSTDAGVRMELPAYGIDNPTGQLDLNAPDILDAISEWEPRAVATTTDNGIVDGVGDLVVNLT